MNPSSRAEQRSHERYPLALPITMEGEEGVTLDLSADGILLETTRRPRIGTLVSLDLNYVGRDGPCHLRCRGEVVRVEPHGDTFNVAVQLSEPLFR